MTTTPPPLVPALTAPGGPLAPLGIPVASRVRHPRPTSAIRVIALGGAPTADYALSAPSALIECWAEDPDAAYLLATQAWQLLRATQGTEISPGLWVQDARLTLPVDNPDTQSKSPRWQFIFTPIVAQEET